MRQFPLLEMRIRLVKLDSLLHHALVQGHVEIQLTRGRPVITTDSSTISHDGHKLTQRIRIEHTGLACAYRESGQGQYSLCRM